jgi:hypothetical protein
VKVDPTARTVGGGKGGKGSTNNKSKQRSHFPSAVASLQVAFGFHKNLGKIYHIEEIIQLREPNSRNGGWRKRREGIEK